MKSIVIAWQIEIEIKRQKMKEDWDRDREIEMKRERVSQHLGSWKMGLLLIVQRVYCLTDGPQHFTWMVERRTHGRLDEYYFVLFRSVQLQISKTIHWTEFQEKKFCTQTNCLTGQKTDRKPVGLVGACGHSFTNTDIQFSISSSKPDPLLIIQSNFVSTSSTIWFAQFKMLNTFIQL